MGANIRNFFFVTGVFMGTILQASEAPIRVVEFKVEKIADKTHWIPEKVEVKPGERIQLKASYDLDGGFDFHGFAIPELKIAKRVERRKPLIISVEVPQSGISELSVNCQFHPAHVGAKILVK